MIAYWVGLGMGLWIGSAAGFAAAIRHLSRDDFDEHADQALQFNAATFMEASDADYATELGSDR